MINSHALSDGKNPQSDCKGTTFFPKKDDEQHIFFTQNKKIGPNISSFGAFFVILQSIMEY